MAADQLQEFAIKNGGFHLKNLRWFCPDLGIQDQIDTISKWSKGSEYGISIFKLILLWYKCILRLLINVELLSNMFKLQHPINESLRNLSPTSIFTKK